MQKDVITPLPQFFSDRILQQFGDQEGSLLLAALNKPPKVSVSKKVNSQLWSDEETIPYVENGVRLSERPSFTLDPRFHLGQYYPQESSSMFIYFLANQINQQYSVKRVIDLCAAPGGKSILLHKALKNAEVLVSNEVNAKRNVILCENLIKWGDPRSIVSQSPLKSIGGNDFWDLVLLDAPCSGEGMFRKDHQSRSEWSPAQVESCAQLQSELLEQAARLTKPGGFLIYSTCTFAPQENELQCQKFLNDEDWECWSDYEIPLGAIWKREGNFTGVQFLPHQVSGEGFFCAVFRKRETASSRVVKDPHFVNDHWRTLPAKVQHEIVRWVNVDLNSIKINDEGQLNWFSVHHDILSKLDRPRQVGIPIGYWIKEKFIPAQGMLTSGILNQSVKKIACGLEQALQLLRGEDWRVDMELANDWYVATWEGLSIAWLKRVGNRFSNHYPKDWRIRRM
jgi:16S rRNA C967 or C1407 C5-methylase (RsmB/RsmF family)/NOL1/NOP2/fmu family ribosome biogenesis protein